MKKSEYKKLIEVQLQKEQEDYQRHLDIRAFLIKTNFALPNKRTLKKELGEDAEYKLDCLSLRKIIYKGVDHLIGWMGSEMNLENFERADSCHGEGAKKRAEQLNAILGDDKRLNDMVKVFNDLEKAMNAIKNAIDVIDDDEFDSYHNPIYYEILEKMGINSRTISNIKYEK